MSSGTSTMRSGSSGYSTSQWRIGKRSRTRSHKDAYFWVVVRHEIDYLRAAREGDRVIARTWVGDAPQGARFDRFVEFTGEDGKLCVRARTHWAIIDKSLGRPVRVPPEVVAPFLGAE